MFGEVNYVFKIRPIFTWIKLRFSEKRMMCDETIASYYHDLFSNKITRLWSVSIYWTIVSYDKDLKPNFFLKKKTENYFSAWNFSVWSLTPQVGNLLKDSIFEIFSTRKDWN